MIDLIDKLMPGGIRLGDGLIFKDSPLSDIVSLDYYDGPVEGLAHARRGGGVIYFRKIWWDDGQDNRLFELHAIDISADEGVSAAAKSVFATDAADHWAHLPDEIRTLADEAARLILISPLASKLYAFCRSIDREMYILPSTVE